MAKAQEIIYQLKVTIVGTNPPVWRRLLVPAHMTLDLVHKVIQLAFDWENYHLHEFRIGNNIYAPDEDIDDVNTEDEKPIQLARVLNKTTKRATYIYDPGDYWDHEIFLERIMPLNPRRIYPVCTDGDRPAPPEDCGGVDEYESLIRALRDRYHPDHREWRRWVGKDYDPEFFSLEEINKRMRTMALLLS